MARRNIATPCLFTIREYKMKISIQIALVATLLCFHNSLFAGEYDGSWQMKDSSGATFKVMLDSIGSASGTHNDAMKHGSWEEKDGNAIIHWNTGWVTRITKKDGHYVKEGFKPGLDLSEKPTNSSEATKIQ